jgi:hypothetical protein
MEIHAFLIQSSDIKDHVVVLVMRYSAPFALLLWKILVTQEHRRPIHVIILRLSLERETRQQGLLTGAPD